MIKNIYRCFVSFFIIFFWQFSASKTFASDRVLADKKFNQAALFMGSNPSMALKELNIAAKLNPKDPKIFISIGEIHLRLNEHQKAIKAFEKTIEVDENYVSAYSNMGYTYMFLKEWDKAIKNFRIILKYPNLAAPHYVHNAIGWAYYEKGEYSKSIEEIKKAIKIKNNYTIAYYNLGLSLIAFEDFNRAIKEFKKAIRYQPYFVQAHNQLAVIYLKKNMKEKAGEEFKKVIELAPGSQLAKEAKDYLDLIS